MVSTRKQLKYNEIKGNAPANQKHANAAYQLNVCRYIFTHGYPIISFWWSKIYLQRSCH